MTEGDLDRALLALEARAATLSRDRARVDATVLGWAQDLLPPAPYKGAKGGRDSGKSHFFAEQMVKDMAADPDLRAVCIREIQRSLEYSAKALIEFKIRELGVSDLFRPMANEIRRRGGDGVCIFTGMQDHTADSIKSLEGFRRAWVEEAQRISKRSLTLLTPTIRAGDAELWFSWNPDQPDDPIEQFMVVDPPPGAVVRHSTYLDNPYVSDRILELAERDRRTDPDAYAHIWLGEYNKRSDAIVMANKTVIEEFDAKGKEWGGPYYGIDWGFSQDPTFMTRSWIGEDRLWIDYEAQGVGVSLDATPALFDAVPGWRAHRSRADSARPETINHFRSRGFDIEPAEKWPGSVADGVAYLRSFQAVVIHPRCRAMADEARLWSYKVDKYSGDPLAQLAEGHDHGWDSLRYAHQPMIRSRGSLVQAWYPGMVEP